MHASLLFTAAPVGRQLVELGGLAPIPELSFALQAAGLGTAVGSAIALRAKRRHRDADPWAITTAWSTLGFAIGAVVGVASAIL